MQICTKRSIRAIVAAAAVAGAFTVRSAGAYVMPHGTHDGAVVGLETRIGNQSAGIFISVTNWRAQYYDGVPPEETGGVGEGVVCFSMQVGYGIRGFACTDAVEHQFESLQSLEVDGAVPVDLYDEDNQFLRTEIVKLEFTLTGTGAPFPGEGVRLNPSPGIELEASLLRDAMVAGTVESKTLDSIDLAPGSAILGHNECVALLAGEDLTEACRD